MLTHRWKSIGVQDPVRSTMNDYSPESLLKMTSMKISQAAAQGEHAETNGLHGLSLRISEVGCSEGKVSDKLLLSNTSGSSECHTDSDLSDQGQENTEISKWAAALELDLKPEPFDDDLDHCSTKTAFYPEVLPASLRVLESTQGLSSEIEQSLFVTDPCLAPVISRLMELERLQTATVQKEQAKLARSQAASASTRNGHRLRKSDPGCKAGISKDAECNSIMNSFIKLMVCPSSSCRCRHHAFPSSKSGQVSRGNLPHPISTKNPHSISYKVKKPPSVPPTLSVRVKNPQKPTVSNRTKSPKIQTGSISAKKEEGSNRKT